MVTVIDVVRGARIGQPRIVIRGNRIDAVEPIRRVPIPSGAQVVDARGKFVIPGLWDMDTHTALNSREVGAYVIT